MELINHTPYSHLLFGTALEDDRFAAAAMLRVTYDIHSDGSAVQTNEHLLPLSKMIRNTQYGQVESDFIFKRDGVDILVFGKAIALGGRATTQMEVTVRVGEQINHRVMVFGDRHWTKNLTYTRPKPFTEMPITLFNSYGGTTLWDGLDVSFPRNPFGKGYYIEEEEAIGKPLPNIEAPLSLIEKWNDSPLPVGFVQCPRVNRLEGNIEYNEMTITKIKHRFFNYAFPEMIADEIKPRDCVEIYGVTVDNDFKFVIPDHKLFTEIKLGDKIIERRLLIDQIGIFPNINKAFISYRFPFRYVFEPLQKRICSLYET